MDPQKPISFTRHLEPDVGARPRAWTGPARPEPAEAERQRRLQIVIADQKRRAFIEAGLDTRQPPEYRGRVFDHADRDGVHPSAFPPMRWEPQGPLSDEFIAFQNYATQTPETHPAYFCPSCTIRANSRSGARCGRCQVAAETTAPTSRQLALPTE